MSIHGGDIYTVQEQLGQVPLLDFSANISPLGVPDSVRTAILERMDILQHYPDTACRKLRSTIAAFHNICPEQIVCGNGGADVLYRLVQTLQPKRALIPVPTFSEYHKALEETGCHVDRFPLSYPFCITDTLLKQLQACSYDFLVLCNPNNPTGMLISQKLLRSILTYAKAHHITVLLDECFCDMIPNETGVRSLIPDIEYYPNLFILKSLTKLYAIAGLRLGYGISADKMLIRCISECGQPWSVNVFAEAAGCAALQDDAYRTQFLQFLQTERIYLYEGLRSLGLKVWKPSANFIFFQAIGLENLDKLLLPCSILIRHCDTYDGLNGEYYRVAVKSHEDNDYLLRCLKKILEQENISCQQNPL